MSQSLRETSNALTSEELALVTSVFSCTDGIGSLHALLRYLNAQTVHRFTGVYRFTPGWVVSVALWDRETPELQIGANVKMRESYCWLTGLGQSSYVIEDAMCDSRLDGHAARAAVRSYVSVALRDRTGTPWGTLCHFDFEPRAIAAETVARLELFRPLIEEMLVRDEVSAWDEGRSDSFMAH